MYEFHKRVPLTDELLLTLICEVENTLNNRSLTAVTTDINNFEALTPDHLLRLHSNIELP